MNIGSVGGRGRGWGAGNMYWIEVGGSIATGGESELINAVLMAGVIGTDSGIENGVTGPMDKVSERHSKGE